MKGSAYVFEVASEGRIPFWAGALIAYLVVLIYVFIGGVRAVAWTNVFQGAFMVVTAWALGLYFAYSLYGGPTAMFEKIAAASPTHLLVGPGAKMSYAAYFSAVLVSVLGFAMWPHLFMKSYTAKSERVLKQTILMYPTFAIFMVPVLFIGFAGIMQVTPDKLGPPDKILPWMFQQMQFPPAVIGLILIGLNLARVRTGVPVSAFTTAVGLVALVWGGLELASPVLNLSFEIPVFAVLLIVFGVFVMGNAVTRRSAAH